MTNKILLQISAVLGLIGCLQSLNSEHMSNKERYRAVRTEAEKHQSHTFHLFSPSHAIAVEPTEKNNNVSHRSIWLGHTPLFFAIKNGYETIVNTLIEENASLNVRDDHGWTPLHVAGFHGSIWQIK